MYEHRLAPAWFEPRPPWWEARALAYWSKPQNIWLAHNNQNSSPKTLISSDSLNCIVIVVVGCCNDVKNLQHYLTYFPPEHSMPTRYKFIAVINRPLLAPGLLLWNYVSSLCAVLMFKLERKRTLTHHECCRHQRSTWWIPVAFTFIAWYFLIVM